MFGSHHCQRCDASLPYKGMCEKCATGPAPKEEVMHQCQFCLRSTHHIDTCDDCREVFTRTGPAPKEEVMPYDEKCTCCRCTEERSRRLLNPYDPKVTVDQLRDEQHAIAVTDARTAERRARFEKAYMAALGGYCAMGSVTHENGQVEHAQPAAWAKYVAIETVRQWDEMMAELDGEEGI